MLLSIIRGVCGGVLSYKSANPILINNTIVYNNGSVGGGGIAIRENAGAILINNILYGNTGPDGSQVNLYDDSADPVFVYCNIQGGKEEFGGAGAGINYSGRYENNIDVDPLFKDSASDNYSLSDSSFCIGAGTDSAEVAGVWYKVPLLCNKGIPRPSPIGSKPDIGACESLLGIPITDVKEKLSNPTEFILFQNYPNPFNPTTTIGFGIPEKGSVRLSVLNILGEEIKILLNEEKEAGYHSIDFNASDLQVEFISIS